MQTVSFVDAIDALKAGKPVMFPTDTVCGLAVAVKYAASPRRINELKQRDAGKSVAWLVGGLDALDEYGVDVPDEAYDLAEQNWPGALTLVVKASDNVPAAFRAPDGTIGLRMPDDESAQRLIRVVGPLAASSANIADEEAPCRVDDIASALTDEVVVVAADDLPGSGVASTVLDCSQGTVSLVRQGDVEVDVADSPVEGDEGVEEAVVDEGEGDEGAADGELDEESENDEDAAVEPDFKPAHASVPASDGIFTIPLEFVSHDMSTTIQAKVWTNDKFGGPGDPGEEDPKAVIQIVHGMAEYIDRYDEFARYLVNRGFVVCAEDHVGHGESADGPEEYGHMPLHGGADVVVGDVYTLHSMVSRAFPDVPYVLYGHSMGSFIARSYIAQYGDELDACVLSGTGNVPAGLSKMGRTLAHFLATIKGDKHRSKLIDNMGAGSYGKKIKGARTNLDWLSTDDEVVNAYIADDKCGFMFTLGGYATLLDLTAEVVTPECAARVPKDLPVLLVAGDGDPVGDMGAGVKAAAKLLSDAGVQTVDCTIYPGMRHEIHNEIGKEQVYDDVATWIEEHI